MELHARGYISGISLLTEYEGAIAFYAEHRNLLVETKTGLEGLDLPVPRADDYEDDRPTVVQVS